MNSITIEELKDFSSKDFETVRHLYSISFPSVESRPIERILEQLKKEDYHLYVAKKNRLVVGISFLYIFKGLKVGLLDYMAIDPAYQRKGIGTKMFKHVLLEFQKKISTPLGLILEIQKEHVSDLQEHKLRQDRIRFYYKLGAKMLHGVNYLLPPQHGDLPEEMYLMFVPFTNINTISNETLVQYIKTIYSKIYHYEKEDLLQNTLKNLPKVIKLTSNDIVGEIP